MLHITHFVLIVSLAVGLVAITVSAQIYRRYRLGFLRAHLSIVISFNLMIFISIIALYIFNLPYGSVPDEVRTAAGMGHEYLIPLLQLLAAYFFLQVIWGMLDRPVSAGTRNIARAVIGAYAVIQAAAIAASITIAGLRLSHLISRLVWFSTIAFIYIMLLVTMRQIGTVGDRKRRAALRTYWSMLLGIITAVIVLIYLQYAGILDISRYNFISAIVIAAMNAAPILYLGWFAERFHGAPKTDWDIDSSSMLLFDRYDITPREQEIIRLICSGRTNKEIAEDLFISLQTVKDHVYRIFRKCDVKNRVRLVNIFLRPLEAEEQEDTNH
jgi:DNA-binding CsgD family transcriptional regulator